MTLFMFTYRKNIEEEKEFKSRPVDEMTRFYNKGNERLIETVLSGTPGGRYAFLSSTLTISSRRMIAMAIGLEILHQRIQQYQKTFQEDILGRIGGDEFAAFIPVPISDGREESR